MTDLRHITYSIQAQTDLEEIWNHIALNSVRSANKIIDDIEHTLSILFEYPKMGRPRPELGRDILSFPIGRYVLFYITTKDDLHLVRVLHHARDSMMIGNQGGFRTS